jgi:hypothetical protein
MGALPNLIIVGAMKCGTTSLHQYLNVHPEIGMSSPKEVNFFSGECSGESLEWYCSRFDPAAKIRGESSQNYSKAHHPMYAGAPQRMSQVIPDCKIIYLVRDPIERYLSHLVENYIGETKRDRAWNIENDHYLKTGMYHYQLGFFLEYFCKEQVLVVELEELSQNRISTMNGIFDFLGVPRFTDDKAFDFVSNENGVGIAPPSIQRSAVYRAARKIAPDLTHKILQLPMVRKHAFPGSLKQDLSLAEREQLAAKFRPDVDKLRELLGRDFPHWSV